MASIQGIAIDILLVAAAGIAAWLLFAGNGDSRQCIPLSKVMSRVKMPPREKEDLREKLVSRSPESCGGSWSPELDQPTAEPE